MNDNTQEPDDFNYGLPYLKLIEASPDGFIVLDEEGTALYANPRASELLQKGSSPVVGQKIGYPLISKESAELRIPGADGTVRTVEIRSVETTWNERKTFLCSLRDITERKEAEDALKKSEELLKQTGQMAKIGGWEIDVEKNTVYWTEATREIHEVTDEYFSNLEEAIDFYPGESRERIIKAVEEAIDKGKPYELELEFITGMGNHRWVRTMGRPEMFKGKCIRLSGVLQDITDRKETEIALKENEERFRVALSDSSIIVWQQDLNLRYTWIYNAHPDFPGENVLGKTDQELLKTHEDAARLTEIKKKVIDTGKDAYEEVTTTLAGKPVYYRLTVEPFYDTKGEMVGITCVSIDITQMKQTLEELEKAKKKAEENDRLKSAFLTNMSHEIRTPMNGVMGFSELLKNPELEGEQKKEYIDVIKQSGERMLNIIDDLVDIARIEAGQTEVEKEKTALNELIENVYSFFKPLADNKKLVFKAKKGLSDSESVILTDEGKLNQILGNLIGNAIKYTSEGEIEFGYNKKNKNLEFYVRDTGIGISTKAQERIFERFTQADVTITRKYEGAGLGLSISKAFIEMIGGEIWVESTQDKGSTFRFTLPYNGQKPDAKPEEETVAISHGRFPKDVTILVAEDDMISFSLLEILLEGHQVKLLNARNGKIAIDMIKENPKIDLVMMDIKMPVMNGYEATKEIKQYKPDLPVIAQTAFASKDDRRKAFEAGCDDYISKPIDKKRLWEILLSFIK